MSAVNELSQVRAVLVETTDIVLMGIQVNAINLARANNQTVGEKNDYYITLQQLESILSAVRVWP